MSNGLNSSVTEDKESSTLEVKEDKKDQLQNVLMTIVHSFTDYFIDVSESIWKKKPKNLTFDEVGVARKIGQTGIQLVDVRFTTELGRGQAAIAVKVYKNEGEVAKSVIEMNFLSERIQPFLVHGIRTPKIIFHRGPILVMEGIKGSSFNRSKVPVVERYRSAGRALAVLHGHTKNKVDNSKNSEMIPLVIENLPISQEIKSILTEQFLLSFESVKKINSIAGAMSFGDFHQGNLMFEVDLTKNPISAVHLIDPDFLEKTTTTDRLEDIANFFSHKVIQEWMDKRRLSQSTRDIDAFIAGYNEILAFNKEDLFNYYTELPPFNFHLALRILFSILNLASMSDIDGNYLIQQSQERINLAQKLLNSEPLLKNEPVF